MIDLVQQTDTLEILLSGAVTTNQLTWVCCYNFITSNSNKRQRNTGVTNDATPVVMTDPLEAGKQQSVHSIVIYNSDTTNKIVTVQFNDATAIRIQITATLKPGQSLYYNETGNWSIYGVDGKKICCTGTSTTGTDKFFTPAHILDVSIQDDRLIGADPNLLQLFIEGIDFWQSSATQMTFNSGTGTFAVTGTFLFDIITPANIKAKIN